MDRSGFDMDLLGCWLVLALIRRERAPTALSQDLELAMIWEAWDQMVQGSREQVSELMVTIGGSDSSETSLMAMPSLCLGRPGGLISSLGTDIEMEVDVGHSATGKERKVGPVCHMLPSATS